MRHAVFPLTYAPVEKSPYQLWAGRVFLFTVNRFHCIAADAWASKIWNPWNMGCGVQMVKACEQELRENSYDI